MCYVGPEVPAHNAMPSGVVLLIKLFLDVGRNVLFNVVLFQGLSGTVHCILLHLFAHVSVLDYGFAISHLGKLSVSVICFQIFSDSRLQLRPKGLKSP